MNQSGKRQPRARRLELTFYRLLLRLSPAQRQHVLQELPRPSRRQWFIVDEHGVRRLE